MNEKEIAEIRRRFNPQKTNITKIRGCLVNEKSEIVSEFSQPVATLMQDEAESLFAVLKKVLSGGIDKNLIDVAFSNEQVLGAEEHKRLLALRDTALSDDSAVKSLFADIISAVHIDGNYLILLACDSYDVFTYSKDGEKGEESGEMFRYFVCGVCPLKLTRPQLSFAAFDNAFHSIAANSVVSAPEIGFMFPTFDDRMGNIYNALFYAKNASVDYSGVVESLFKAEIPMPAAQQKETFGYILRETINDECNLEVMQAIHEQVNEMVEEHKESRSEEPLAVSKEDISEILRSCEVADERIESFEKTYDETFGGKTRLNPKNLVDTKQFEVHTSDVTVKVKPERCELLQTRIIDGVKYILIRADEAVEVNGVSINLE